MIPPKTFKRLKGIVFDLDDTLYLQSDYKRSGFRAVACWLAQNQSHNEAETFSALIEIMTKNGPSFPYMFDDFLNQRQGDAALVKKLTDVFINHTPNISCFPGIHSLLESLHKSYLTGILTDGRQLSQQKKIEALDLQNRVDTILLSDSLGLAKPAPKLFEWFEEIFHLRGPELAYIGDNPQKDFLGPNTRGWVTVRVLTGEHATMEAIGEGKPKVVIPHAVHLEEWLKNQLRY